MFLCALASLPCYVLYFLQVLEVLNYNEFEKLEKNTFLCKASSSTYKVVLVVNKCLTNLIFAFRYKTINKRCPILVKRAYFYSILVVAISAFQLLLDFFYFMFAKIDSKENCLFLKFNFNENSLHVILMATCFAFVTTMQGVILVEIIKPIYKHLNNTNIFSSRSLKLTFYRVVVCSFLFSVSDFLFLIIQFITVKTINRPMPIVLIANVELNLLSLICSYKNYKRRLFPFLKTNRNQKVDDNKHQMKEIKTKPSTYVTSKLKRSLLISKQKKNTSSSLRNLRELCDALGVPNCEKELKSTLKRCKSL